MVARALGVLTGSAADGDVAKSATVSPVTAAGFAEMARLREIIVIVVAEFGVERIAARAGERVGLRRGRERHGVLGLFVSVG